MELISKYFSDFSPIQVNQFEQLGALYAEWNEKINVISRKDINELYERHVLHSLSIAAEFDFIDELEIIDLGTGGGFPGVPLAIFFPNVRFHLVDSIGKKLKVVDAICQELGIQNVTTQHTRAEEIKNRKFDFVVSRAVAPLKDLWTWSRPLLKKEHKMPDFKNGLICLKGGDLAQEIAESGLKTYAKPIEQIFEEEYYKDKFIIYVPV
ncbi:MAG: 16S rRNA (guanine(527)-N(7))-methyltransferase RsmG [Chitinophagaceae bacterium]